MRNKSSTVIGRLSAAAAEDRSKLLTRKATTRTNERLMANPFLPHGVNYKQWFTSLERWQPYSTAFRFSKNGWNGRLDRNRQLSEAAFAVDAVSKNGYRRMFNHL